MKKLTYTLLIVIFMGYSIGLKAQKIEAEKTHVLSKDAAKGELFHFDYNKDEQTYLLAFKREVKSGAVCEFYKFDKDFNLISNETLKVDESKDKYSEAYQEDYNPDSEANWSDPKVLRVEANLGGQIVMNKGHLSRRWVTDWEDKGSYRYYHSYWRFDFNSEEKIKPKFDGVINIPEDAPKFVQNMAKKAGEKLLYVGHITDEPTVQITTGRRSYIYPSLSERNGGYSNASGDVLIIGRSDQMNFDEGNMTKRPMYTTYVGLKYKAEDLSVLNSSTAYADCNALEIYKRALWDGSFVIIVAPSKYASNDKTKPEDYRYIRFAKDGSLIDNIAFESKGGPWKVYGAALGGDNDVYVWGGTSSKKKGNYHPASNGMDVKQQDVLQYMKIKDNNIAYFNTVSIDDVNAKMIQPEGQKKAAGWSGKDFMFWEDPIITDNATIIIPGNPIDKSAFHYFQINPDGEFAGQYVMNFEQKAVEGANIVHIVYKVPETEKYTCMLMEVEKSVEGKEYRYPRVATLDLKNTKLTTLQDVGYGKEKYYLNDGYPITYIENGKKVTFLSFDAKNKNIYLGRVNFE